MPISTGSAGGIPGLNLKAWAYITAAGALIRGYNVASTSKGATGTYTVNFTVAMSSADYVARCTPGVATGATTQAAALVTATTAAATVRATANGAAFDTGGLWEFYE